MNCVLVILLCLRYLPCCNDFVYFYCLLCFIGFQFTFVFVVFFGFFFSSLLCVLLVFDLLLSIAVPFYSWFCDVKQRNENGKMYGSECANINVYLYGNKIVNHVNEKLRKNESNEIRARCSRAHGSLKGGWMLWQFELWGRE